MKHGAGWVVLYALDGLCFTHISRMLLHKHRKQIGSVEAMLCHTKRGGKFAERFHCT